MYLFVIHRDITVQDAEGNDIFSTTLETILSGRCEVGGYPVRVPSEPSDTRYVFRSVKTNTDSSLENNRSHHSDSSDDYAGDSDDCSL